MAGVGSQSLVVEPLGVEVRFERFHEVGTVGNIRERVIPVAGHTRGFSQRLVITRGTIPGAVGTGIPKLYRSSKKRGGIGDIDDRTADATRGLTAAGGFNYYRVRSDAECQSTVGSGDDDVLRRIVHEIIKHRPAGNSRLRVRAVAE